ncbi:MAG: precorrin-2 C(20)-methyltransferase [Bermanella sp.]
MNLAPQYNIDHGRFMGVGVGPGDPELITLKAARLIESSQVICYLANKEGASQSRNIAKAHIHRVHIELPIYMPMSDDPTVGSAVYDEAAIAISKHLMTGHSVVFLCEGDPLFFGSFSYLLERLTNQYHCEVVPGIPSPNAASARLQKPLTMLKESFAVISGRHTDAHILHTLNNFESVVIMKAGRNRVRILNLLNDTNREEDAHYLEYIGRENEKVIEDVTRLERKAGPYFSLFVILPQKRQRHD